MGKILKKSQPMSWWRRILLGLVLTAMALLVIFLLLNYVLERQLGAEVTRINQAGEPLTFLDLRAQLGQSGTGDDAAGYYAAALSRIPPGDLSNLMRVNTFYRKNIIALPASQFPGDVRERVMESLAKFQPAMEMLDKGAALPLRRFDIGIEGGIKACMGRLARVQTAFCLLSQRTLDLILRGEDDAATNSAISMLKILRVFDSYPTMVLHRVKAGLIHLACDNIYLLLEYGRPSEKSLAALQKALSQTIPEDVLEKIFLAERVYQMELGRNLIPENTASRLLGGEVPDLPERLPLPGSRWLRLRLRRKSIQYFREAAGLMTVVRSPWPEPLDVIVVDSADSAKKPSRLVSGAAVSVRSTAEALVAVRCTLLVVMVERYRKSHGELPRALDDLCPAYINSIPLDPYTGGKPLYSHDEETYLVYSTGFNRRDDGGSIISDAAGMIPQDRGLRIRWGGQD